MKCPHCDRIGKCVWVGFGKDWVVCQYCQRRSRWLEVQRNWLVTRQEAWRAEAPASTPSYN